MKICIFTVIKDEQEYIEDFIRYHINLGVDTLFIFEDINSSSHKEITDKYDQVSLHSVSELFLTDKLKEFKENGTFQKQYIKKGLIWIRDNYDYDWCFSLDCDEYITPTEPFPNLLNDYSKHDAIMIQWKNFGASGHVKKPLYNKPIWEIYTKECEYSLADKKYCNCTKICFNMKKLQEKFIFGNHAALCNYVKTDFTWDRTKIVFDRMYLRHYITKSWEEYVWKLKVRGMMHKEHRGYNDFFEMNTDMADMKDELIKEADIYLKNNNI